MLWSNYVTLHSRSEHKALTVYGKTTQCMRGSEAHDEKKAGGGVIQNEIVCIPTKERVSSFSLGKIVLASLS